MVGVDLRRDVVETVLMDLIKQEVNIVKRVSSKSASKSVGRRAENPETSWPDTSKLALKEY